MAAFDQLRIAHPVPGQVAAAGVAELFVGLVTGPAVPTDDHCHAALRLVRAADAPAAPSKDTCVLKLGVLVLIHLDVRGEQS
jgi:hypothetical protein